MRITKASQLLPPEFYHMLAQELPNIRFEGTGSQGLAQWSTPPAEVTPCEPPPALSGLAARFEGTAKILNRSLQIQDYFLNGKNDEKIHELAQEEENK
jgi:hypothetical protein